ncbi:MAG TPA: Mov34/MPN/PAD-1 family protein, partial [Candidatus Eremiobacteraeota bacterium]|nr:Mov34/MPN/PAD-1 family protein [Candidatus Eremiobacteraeota bacterium]
PDKDKPDVNLETGKRYSTSTDYTRDRSKELIVKPREMLLNSTDFFCELRGNEPVSGEYKIFIIELALKAIWNHAKEGMPHGVGGLLMGGLYRDMKRGEDYVEIHNAFPSAATFNEEMNLRVVNRVIAEMEQVSLKSYPSEIVVGWYHTHPDAGIFFSENDELIHRTFYREPTNVALILDPIMEIDPLRETYKNIAFFYWNKDSIKKSSGYFAYKLRQPESISPVDRLREKYHKKLSVTPGVRAQIEQYRTPSLDSMDDRGLKFISPSARNMDIEETYLDETVIPSVPFRGLISRALSVKSNGSSQSPSKKRGLRVTPKYGDEYLATSREKESSNKSDMTKGVRGLVKEFLSNPYQNDYSSENYLSEPLPITNQSRKLKKLSKAPSMASQESGSLYIEFDTCDEDSLIDDENDLTNSYDASVADSRKLASHFRTPQKKNQEVIRKPSPAFVRKPSLDSSDEDYSSPPLPASIPRTPKVVVQPEYIKQSKINQKELRNFIGHPEGSPKLELEPEYDPSYYEENIRILGGRNWRMEQRQVIHDPYETPSSRGKSKSGLLKAHKYKYYGNEESTGEKEQEE